MFVNDLHSAVCYEAKFSEAMGKIFGDIYIPFCGLRWFKQA